jgi:hypothetical protein
MAVVMAIMILVMSATAVRAGFSLEGYTFTFAPQVNEEYLSLGYNPYATNITNNGLVGMGCGAYSGYWNTGNNTTVYDLGDFVPVRVNSSGITTLPSTEETQDINDAGIVVGASNDFANAVVWNEGLTGSPTVLIHPDGYNTSMAQRISSNGSIIAGYVEKYDNGWTCTPIMWDADRNPVLLPTVSGANTYWITAINDAGLIAGNASSHAVVWNTGAETLKVTELESTSNTLDEDETISSSYAYGINESGIITGSITINGVSGSHGVLWVPKEGGEYDLIDVNKWAEEAGLLVNGTGMEEGLVSILSIADINDSNQIVGTGYYRRQISDEEGSTWYGNQQVVFLLNPGMMQVPESGATAVVAGAAAMLACAAMRRRRQRGQR